MKLSKFHLRLLSLILGASMLGAQSSLAQTEPEKIPVAEEPGGPVTPKAEARALLRGLNDLFADLFEVSAPGVVVVEVIRVRDSDSFDPFRHFFMPGQPDEPDQNPGEPGSPDFEGSGFVVRDDGMILTNHHVIANASSIRVRLQDGRKFDAKLQGQDEKTDIAVLKIEAEDLTVLELADSDKVRVGEMVAAIGAPYALDYSLTVGWVSAKGRTGLQSRMGTEVMYEEYIQTDAAINPGNSGGPLLDVDGRVIGMNTLIHGIQRGLGFAIPSNMLRQIGESLMEHGRVIRPWLGIGIASVEDERVRARARDAIDGVETGVLVLSIMSDGPAYDSELRPSDVIMGLNGEGVRTAVDLQKAVLKRTVGEEVTLDVWRRGEKLAIKLKTAEMAPSATVRPALTLQQPDEDTTDPEADAQALDLGEGPVMQPGQPPGDAATPANAHGLQLQPLTKELAQGLGVSTENGLVITDVAEGSAASQALLQREDVITEVDSKPVTTLEDFEKILAQADLSRGVLVYFERKGERSFAVLKSGSANP